MLPLLLVLSTCAAAIPALEPRACGDNCARAVIASAFTTRHGAQDCSSYLLTTVTPATSTITDTSTLTFFPTVTVPTTVTDTTTTTVDVIAFTETVTNVVTDTVTTTSTLTVNWPGQGPTRKKRQETSVPSLIPEYASACSGSARYSTACACVGVFPSTTTAATPLTTKTAYVSVSITATVTTIAATATDVITAVSSGTTTITTVSTTTVTAATTPTVTLPAFRLQVSGGWAIGTYVETLYELLGLNLYESQAALWTLDESSHALIEVASGDTAVVGSAPADLSQIRLVHDPSPTDWSPLICEVSVSGSDRILTCAPSNNPQATDFSWNEADTYLYMATSSAANSGSLTGSLPFRLIDI
ncbi:hypothetical protein VTK73DRAFT_4334 [Phialemonium thermophilum]|uniref:Ig-like domain-containing protein n=1 Tax=Phialemonium thermophilum TaxID=223376 RepID=A0ABR3WU48_9PEZI